MYGHITNTLSSVTKNKGGLRRKRTKIREKDILHGDDNDNYIITV